VREGAEAQALLAAKRERPAQALPPKRRPDRGSRHDEERPRALGADGAAGRAGACPLLQRERFTGPDDLVFPNEVGRWLDAEEAERSALLVAKRERAAPALRELAALLGEARQLGFVLERIRREREAGKSLAAIANGLNADRIPTAQGGQRWYPATIRSTLKRVS